MLAFCRRNQVLLSSFFSLALSLYILVAASTGRLRADPVSMLLMQSMRPLQRGLHSMVLGLREMRVRYGTLKSLWSQNEELRQRMLEMEVERDRLLEAEATYRRLQKLLDLKVELVRPSVTANVIGNSASTWFKSLTVDKGSRDRIHKGMAVISPLGVVGQVVEVAAGSAKVLLIADHYSGVDVMTQRTRARGVVSGSLEDGPVMKYVRRNEDIAEGDRLITSGLDGVFPKGLLVGTVSRVSGESFGLFRHVAVELAVDPSRIEEVLVVSAEAAKSRD